MDESTANQIRTLIYKASAVDVNNRYVNFYKLWLTNESLIATADLISKYIKKINAKNKYFSDQDLDKLLIITPDTIGGKLGVTPVAFEVSKNLGCNVAVWKEFADIKWGTSTMIALPSEDYNCLLLQDVVDQGTVVLKIAHAIKEFRWNFRLFLTVVLNKEFNQTKTLAEVSKVLGYEPDFEFITTLDYLLEGSNEHLSPK